MECKHDFNMGKCIRCGESFSEVYEIKEEDKLNTKFDKIIDKNLNVFKGFCEHPGIDNTTNKCIRCGKDLEEVEIEREIVQLDKMKRLLEEEEKTLSKITSTQPSHKKHNVGSSDYAKHIIQPWDIWRVYNLNPWDAEIIKLSLRTKECDTRIMDYQKIIHICEERIAQLEGVYDGV